MGRYYYSKKDEADSLKKIQVWWLKKYGYLKSGWQAGGIKWTNGWTGKESNISFYINIFGVDNYLQLVYTQTDYSSGEKQDFDYKIALTTTRCHFGGVRYWFTCPWYANGKYCGRRVGVLYLGGKYFACRYCYDLSYESRNENRRFRDYPLFFVLGGMRKIEELEQNIKRKYYRGKLTRKQRVLENLQWRMLPHMESVRRKKDIDN